MWALPVPFLVLQVANRLLDFDTVLLVNRPLQLALKPLYLIIYPLSFVNHPILLGVVMVGQHWKTLPNVFRKQLLRFRSAAAAIWLTVGNGQPLGLATVHERAISRRKSLLNIS